jgi:hypothetical protein
MSLLILQISELPSIDFKVLSKVDYERELPITT